MHKVVKDLHELFSQKKDPTQKMSAKKSKGLSTETTEPDPVPPDSIRHDSSSTEPAEK